MHDLLGQSPLPLQVHAGQPLACCVPHARSEWRLLQVKAPNPNLAPLVTPLRCGKVVGVPKMAVLILPKSWYLPCRRHAPLQVTACGHMSGRVPCKAAMFRGDRGFFKLMLAPCFLREGDMASTNSLCSTSCSRFRHVLTLASSANVGTCSFCCCLGCIYALEGHPLLKCNHNAQC